MYGTLNRNLRWFTVLAHDLSAGKVARATLSAVSAGLTIGIISEELRTLRHNTLTAMSEIQEVQEAIGEYREQRKVEKAA